MRPSTPTSHEPALTEAQAQAQAAHAVVESGHRVAGPLQFLLDELGGCSGIVDGQAALDEMTPGWWGRGAARCELDQ